MLTFSLLAFHLLLHVFLLSFSHLALCCPIEVFSCGSPAKKNTSPSVCGGQTIRCFNHTLQFQFGKEGLWYTAENIMYPERTLVIHDMKLGKRLQSTDCDFLYKFTPPINGIEITNIESKILFDCRPTTYDFSRDLFRQRYGYTDCMGYELYYSHEPNQLVLSDDDHENCTMPVAQTEAAVRWEFMFQEEDKGVVGFSLKSVSFSRRYNPISKCFGCRLSGGECSSVQADSSSCICHHPCPGSKRLGLKIGLAVGVTVGIIFFMVACLAFFLYRRHKNKRSYSFTSFFRKSSTASDPSSIMRDPTSLSGSYYKTPIFSYEELDKATGGFDEANELGDGGFGVVFKGKLKDGRIVAVKRLYERNHRRVKQFRNEVEILNRLRHRNLVSFYGCTSARDSPDLVLVYEYIPNGTVADHLHGSRAAEHALTWSLRLVVAIETADALTYLHAHHPQIIHRDVKTSNILLDDNFSVKVADFGLSRLFPLDVTHVSTAPQGTPGYVDPEYHQCYQLTDKSDVYSFGVVLVELISSMPAVDISRNRSEINLSNMAVDKIPKGLVGEMVDPMLGFSEDAAVRAAVERVAEVAFMCLQGEKDMRPTMEEVREMLKDIAAGGDGRSARAREKDMGDEAYLLKPSALSQSFSPKSVADRWASVSTTPGASA